MYGMIQVLQSVLAGHGDCCMNPSLDKDRTQFVISLHSFLKSFERARINGIPTGNVKGIHERRDGTDHHRWDVSGNCSEKDLEDVISMPNLIR